ncbi:MAG: type I methionyl aminopeptidase [Chloroflexota bacterium]|nr:type I methionyl aminopeptidase [Chloroflexota bacterium]
MIITRPEEFSGLQRANQATTRLLRELEAFAKPGLTTRALDEYARAYIRKLSAEPVFETQNGFPGAINTNRNDIVVHGIPGDERLVQGDILTIDAGMLFGGFAGDAATTFTIGPASTTQQALIDATWLAMNTAIEAARTGNSVGDVSWAMQSVAESHGYNVARGFCGHGIGRRCWEDPQVPFAGDPGTGPKLVEGMVITVEPVVIEGAMEFHMANRWEARTVDGTMVAQFERAIMVTASGGVILSGD